MIANPYKGEAVIELGGTPYVLRYDWQGFAILREQLGEAFEIETAQALAGFNFDYVAKVLAVGLRQSYPGITAELIMQMDPPPAIGVVAEAISLAFRRTWWGKEGKPPEPKANPLMRLLRAMRRRIQFSAG